MSVKRRALTTEFGPKFARNRKSIQVSADDAALDSIVNLNALAEDRVFTYRYRQPRDYHFCLDSIIFGGYVVSEISKRWPVGIPEDFRAVDICAGCGVIGFEISHSVPEIKHFDFIEIQDAFRESFEGNLAQALALAPREFRFLQIDFRELSRPSAAGQYDLIVANPPYFFEGEGLLSPSSLKNRCRFFLDGNLRDLIEASVNALTSRGVAYLLIKTGTNHGRDVIRDLKKTLADKAQLSFSANIRGTSVLCVTRVDIHRDQGPN